ncbi:MAG: AAA family ATPase [Thermoplasmatota archaeon]
MTDAKREYLKRVTVENRILLLLLDHVKDQDSYSVPEAVTQGGMSEILSVRQNNLSRDLQSLETRGLIQSRSAHVTGSQRRKKVYFLAQEGIDIVNSLSRELRRSYVIVKDRSGEIREWKLGKLADLLSEELHRKVSLHEVVENVLEGGEADIGSILGKEGKAPISGAPVVKEFYGRQEELSEIETAFGREGSLVLSVISIAGQGKTSLVSKFVSTGRLRCSWFKVNQWLTPRRLLTDLGSELREMGFRANADLGASEDHIDLHDEIDLIVDGMDRTGLVLVLDDAHDMSTETVEVIRLLRDRSLLRKKRTRTILISRERPRVYTRTQAQLKSDILEVQLEGLDRESVSSFLLSKGIPRPFHEDYYLKTRGHPMTIALLGASPEAPPEEVGFAIGRMIEDEVLSSLDKEELSVMELVSIMEIPVEKELLYSLAGVNRETVGDLISRLLLREYENGTIDLHDLLKDSIRPAIPSEALDKYRKIAYSYFSKRGRDIDLVQTMHFAIELRMADDVVDLISDHGEYLLGRGYPQVVETVDMMSGKVTDPVKKIKLLLIKADSERIRGDLDNANRLLEKASDIAMTVKTRKGADSQPILLSKVLRRSAEVKGVEGSGKDVLEIYLKSLALVEASGDREEAARVYSGTGMAYLGMREFDRSISYLRKALDIYIDLGSERGAAEIRTDLGIVYYRKLELANSLRELLHAARISREGGFQRSRSLAHFSRYSLSSFSP